MNTFNERIKQVLLLSALVSLIGVVLWKLFIFLPGLLGAITLYILCRRQFFLLIEKRKRPKGLTAGLFIVFFVLAIGVPCWGIITLLSPKVNAFLSDPTATVNGLKQTLLHLQKQMGFSFASDQALSGSLDKIVAFIPVLINSIMNLFSNFVILLFVLYYLLYNGREIEKTITRFLPLKNKNTTLLSTETKKIVKANALGIPFISFIQGLAATLSYFIFGVNEWALWGVFTTVLAFFPVIGTMVVWVPIVIYKYAEGSTGEATGLLIYNLIITGTLGHIARIFIVRKMGKIHPVITIFGVIVGLGLFGFVGLIFGPLLISYIVVLFKIYMSEFVEEPTHRLSDHVRKTTSIKKVVL